MVVTRIATYSRTSEPRIASSAFRGDKSNPVTELVKRVRRGASHDTVRSHNGRSRPGIDAVFRRTVRCAGVVEHRPIAHRLRFGSTSGPSILDRRGPSDPDHWLIGTGNGGIWQSRDAGGSWTPLTDAAPTLTIGAVAFAPSDPSIIYAATGEATMSGFTKAGLGILKSVNRGQTWTLLATSSFARTSVRRVRVHPSDPNIVFAISSRGGFGRDSQEGAPSPHRSGCSSQPTVA